jgi:hypothetical protein
VRKSHIPPISETKPAPERVWLDLDRIDSVGGTSEEPGYLIESALMGDSRGWRAARPGTQIVRITFDRPRTLRHIWLVFEDSENARTQEFVLRWSQGQEPWFREIVRQQWNFSPGGSVRASEDYTVHLSEVETLELIIVPDKSGGEARASLRSFRLGCHPLPRVVARRLLGPQSLCPSSLRLNVASDFVNRRCDRTPLVPAVWNMLCA